MNVQNFYNQDITLVTKNAVMMAKPFKLELRLFINTVLLRTLRTFYTFVTLLI